MLPFAILFVLADVPQLHFPQDRKGQDSAATDSIKPKDSSKLKNSRRNSLKSDSIPADSLLADSLLEPDTAQMDSLHRLIWLRNKEIDDSLRADSLNRQRKNGIDSPVEYTAEDSMIYEGDTKLAYLYGNSHVKYENMDLESDQIYLSMDSSLVHATGSVDSVGKKFGTPVFKMGSDTYETDTMAFNFKTKKGLISNVYTQQDDGFMTSELSKRGANGDMFLYHGRYTTCDLPHPDFYFAMSRAKVL